LSAVHPDLATRIEWLDALPARYTGVAIANEVLDAMPTHVVRTHEGRIDELGVALHESGSGYTRSFRPATGELLAAAQALALPEDYETEINLAARAFTKSLGSVLERGAMILIDYGFPAAEYYHPQRTLGTMMCHYAHRAHDDPYCLVGLQDITAHVDFSAIAEAAVEAGLGVLGYATQAQFLVSCGITDILAATSPADVRAYAPLAGAAQKLLSPAEMGELFKVLSVGKGVALPLLGYTRGDRAHTL
jgi:SAM-dependent MidA family methyltransferase